MRLLSREKAKGYKYMNSNQYDYSGLVCKKATIESSTFFSESHLNIQNFETETIADLSTSFPESTLNIQNI
jgi:hypothetical protein